MDDPTKASYLARIGCAAPARPDLAALRDLMRAHLRTVPFENCSIHLGEPIELSAEAMLAKVVDRRRGGFCYELNGAFAGLLTRLGYDVTLLAARVHGGGHLGPPFDHLTLRVDLAEPWLVDVGFGRFIDQPVRFGAAGEQHDVGGVVRFEEARSREGYVDLDVFVDDVAQFRIDQRPRELAEFEATCWYQQTSPSSHFATSLVCSMPTADGGRVTLSERTLIVTSDGERTETRLSSDDDVLGAYRRHFGLELDRVPRVAVTPSNPERRGP